MYVAFTESSYNSINRYIALEFAKFLNVKLKPIITTWEENFSLNGKIPSDLETNPNISYTPDALKKADFICGTIYVYEWRKKLFDYAGIMYVSDLLVVRKGFNWHFFFRFVLPEEVLNLEFNYKEIKSYKDLKGLKIALLSNSSYEKDIERINRQIGGGINVVYTKSEEESQYLMEQGKVDGFVAVSYLALKYLRNHPEARLAFPVGKPFKVGWAVEKGNKELQKEINNFYETIKGNGKLDRLFLKHYNIDYKTYLEIINSFAQAQSIGRDLDEIKASGKIIIALRPREMIYHPTGKKQFSHYLAEEFAKYLGLDLEIVVAPNIATYFEDSQGKIVKDSSYTPEFMKKVDVVVDLLEPVPWRLNKVDIVGYMPLAKVVVACKNTKISNIADLKKLKGVTAKGSSYEQALIDNGITNYYYASAEKLMDEVASARADYTLQSFIYNISDYPNLEAKFIIGDINKVGWAIKRNQPKLRQSILEFFEYADKYDILDTYFKMQTSMPFKSIEKYLIALHQAYNIGIFPFVFYGTDQGLPQEDIWDIFQDNEGYMWFATLAGVVRYNGRKMTIYTIADGLLSNEVFDIEQDKKDSTLYFATFHGISAYKNHKFDTVYSDKAFRFIYIDPFNNKWFYGDFGTVILKNDKTLFDLNYRIKNFPFKVYSVKYLSFPAYYLLTTNKGLYLLDTSFSKVKKISSDIFYDIYIDEDDNIWLTGNNGIFYNNYPLKITDGYLGERVNKELKIDNEIITKILKTKDGSIWLLSNFKAYQIFSLRQSPIIYDKNIGLSGQRILSFYTDNEGNYWFGYSGGIQKLTNKSLRKVYPDKLRYYVHSMAYDKYNHLWIAFTNSLYWLGDSLVNFSQRLDKNEKSYSVSLMPDNNVIVASTSDLYIINPQDLQVIKHRRLGYELPQVYKVFVSSKNEIFILTGSNDFIYYLKDFDSEIKRLESPLTTFVYQLVEYDGLVIGGNNTSLIYFNGEKFKILKQINHTVWTLKVVNDTLYVGTEAGLGIFYAGNFELINDLDLLNNYITAIIPANKKGYFWIGTNEGFVYLSLKEKKVEFTVDANDGLPGNEIAFDGLYLDPKGLLWVGTLHGIATYDIKKKEVRKFAPNCQIEAIYLNGERVFELPKLLKPRQNNLTFELTGLSYKNEESLVYDYYLRGLKSINYPGWKGNNYKCTFQNLPPGRYEFSYRAMGKDGIWSYYKSVRFEIMKPLWQKTWFISLIILFVLVMIYVFVKWREYNLKKRNELLERLVEQRTHEIEMQKLELEKKNIELEQQQEEIIVQRDELARQRDVARRQRDEIAKQKQAIMDSIYYAKKIQSAILPPTVIIKYFLPEFFILYLPKDIVSGDFYWIKKIGDDIIVVAGDCTGHGVPGAFMSMLGIALIEEITYQLKDNLNPGKILDALRNRVIESLHQTGKVEEAKDGMDIALYILNRKTLRLQFSGAFNPLIIIRKDTLFELKPDRMPIGIFENVRDSFHTIIFDLEKNDMIYSFSDGYASQFGSSKGKKFRISRLRKLLLAISDLPVEDQKESLYNALRNWMGEKYEQVDDILIIGVRVVWEREEQVQPYDRQVYKDFITISTEQITKKTEPVKLKIKSNLNIEKS